MANPTMKQILDQTRALVGTKLAAAKSAEIVGQAPSSMPGAEHDKPVDASTKKPDSETRDGTMVPASGTSTSGAGDDSPITRGHALESDESAKEPAKKPAITADANAKTAADSAADLANDILSMVRSAQKSAAATPAAALAPAPTPEKVAAAPAPAAPVRKDPAAAPEKVAGQLNMELTTDVMAKIAALILSTEEGAAMANGILEKAAGAEAARDTMAFLAEQAELAEKVAAYEQGLADADRAIAEQIYAAGVKQGQAQMQKHPLFKLGQDAADASMGGLPPEAAAAMAGGAMPPDAGGAMPPDAGAEGGGGELSSEDVVGALQMLVDDGTLQPEEAQQVLDALMGGAGGDAGAAAGGAEGGAMPPDAGAAEAGGEGGGEPSAEGEDPEKEASAKAGKLLAAIKAIQAK